ncbi:MAG: hypothetical protein ABW252_17020 [Polyangiales bacterium]
MGVLPRALIAGTAVLSLVMLLVRARAYWPFTVDDTFITLRYAKHFAEGLGPTWNPSGPPVEGYTTALWMLLLAAPHALGVDALWFAKASGVVFMFATICLAAALAYELARALDPRARRVAALAPFAVSIAYWPTALHAISGMETALSALLLTLFVLVTVRLVRDPARRRMRSVALIALLSVLARPETVVCCGIALIATIALVPRDRRKGFGRALSVYLLVPGLAYFAGRYAYFGLVFPLSLYVKATGQAKLAGLDDVRAFFAPFVLEWPQLGLLAIYGAVGQRRLVPALLGLLGLVVFFVYPAHIMGFEGRYLFPTFPTLSALIGVGAAKLAHHALTRIARLKAVPRADLVLAALAAIVLAAFMLPRDEPTSRARWIAYGSGMERAHVALANALKRAKTSVVRPTIALLDVGAVAYYSDWYVIDTFGLNDARVALSRRTDVDYVFAQRPELVVVVSESPARFAAVFDWEQPIYDQALQRGYEPMCSYRFDHDYHLQVLARPSSPIREALTCPKIGETSSAARAELQPSAR